jgi:ABC-type phosphate transport system substrate-binding protein
MTKKPVALLVLAAALSTPAAFVAPASAAVPFKVVINVANATSALSRDEVARIFLKKIPTWPGGQTAQPVDQSKDSAVRKAFSKTVLGKEVEDVEAYWQQSIFSGRAVPPPEKASDADVLAFVRSNPNAVGYVSGSAELGASVKELIVK